MRPNRRADHAVDTARIRKIGVSMLASSARDPVVALPFAEVAGRRPAGVVDQDVRVGTGRQRLGAARFRRDVAGDRA